MRIIFALMVSVFLLSLNACISFSDPATQETKIGVLLPLSGKRAFSGKKTLSGIFLAHDQINKKGLVRGKMIKLVIIDNKSSAKGSRLAMKRFIDKEKVTLVIAACSTANALAIKATAAKAKVPVLLTISTGNIATERNPYMFRCCFNDDYQAKAMAVFAYKDKMYTDIGILLDLNEQVTYRRDLGRAFAAAFKKSFGRTVKEIGYRSGTHNFAPQMKKFKQSKTVAIFAPGDIPDAGIILKQARKNGVRKVFLGSDGWDHSELFDYCGPRPAPCFLTSMFSPESGLPGVKDFARSIKARTGAMPGTDTAQAYDALNITIKALKLSKSQTDIRSGLYQIKNYSGVTGTISINAGGNAAKTIFIKKIIKKANNKFAFKLIKTISPK
ncbi:MAG: ABC transporter substrate-binding protein [Victivallaceae bacterium]|nr:ABC transporter substrate-binding protein [Victivallaceae bacterium]